MKKFVPYEKLSKAKQREFDRKKRATWRAISPVTRKSKNEKIYNRKKSQRYDDYSHNFEVFIFLSCFLLAMIANLL